MTDELDPRRPIICNDMSQLQDKDETVQNYPCHKIQEVHLEEKEKNTQANHIIS